VLRKHTDAQTQIKKNDATKNTQPQQKHKKQSLLPLRSPLSLSLSLSADTNHHSTHRQTHMNMLTRRELRHGNNRKMRVPHENACHHQTNIPSTKITLQTTKHIQDVFQQIPKART